MPGPADWTIQFNPGAVCRTIMWQGQEVALVNPRGDFSDADESDLAAGLAHSGRMHACLKRIDGDLNSGGGMLTQATIAELRAVLASVMTIDTGRYIEPDEIEMHEEEADEGPAPDLLLQTLRDRDEEPPHDPKHDDDETGTEEAF